MKPTHMMRPEEQQTYSSTPGWSPPSHLQVRREGQRVGLLAGGAAAGVWPCGDGQEQGAVARYGRKRPAIEGTDVAESGDDHEGRGEAGGAKLLRPVGAADEVDLAFDASCRSLEAMRLEGGVDPAKARFIG